MDELDSAIEKLIEYSKEKRSISWDELNGMLPSEILNSDKMEIVLSELAKNNIQLEDDTDELDKVEDDEDFVQQATTFALKAIPLDMTNAILDNLLMIIRIFARGNNSGN